MLTLAYTWMYLLHGTKNSVNHLHNFEVADNKTVLRGKRRDYKQLCPELVRAQLLAGSIACFWTSMNIYDDDGKDIHSLKLSLARF